MTHLLFLGKLRVPSCHGSFFCPASVRCRFLFGAHASGLRAPATEAGNLPMVDVAHFDSRHDAQHIPCVGDKSRHRIPAMPELPICGNFAARTCERSDVFVSKETDGAFIITCRTCKGISVWPKERDENAGRYQSFLKHQAAREAQRKHESSRPAYSFADLRRK